MPRLRITALTIVAIAAAVVLVVIGIIYFTTAAKDLPAFFPGHAARDTHHHVKHGIAAFTLAVAALLGAWFTTAPERPTSN